MKDTEKTCSFFGHRKIDITNELKHKLFTICENLIVEKNVNTFLFGSKSRFYNLCYEIISVLKEKYPYIERIYVRAEFPYIDEKYESYLLEKYEGTFFPEKIINSGKAIYIERNFEMINNSAFCIFYYDENYLPPRRKNSKTDLFYYQPESGTRIAYEYAKSKNKRIFLFHT